MAESPLVKVARLVGGVAMMQGGLGHQVLGQLLIGGSGHLAVAGAAVAVAGTARARNPAAQLAIRTAAPALAVHAMFDRRERMLLLRERELSRRAQTLGATDFALEKQNAALKRGHEEHVRVKADLQNTNKRSALEVRPLPQRQAKVRQGERVRGRRPPCIRGSAQACAIGEVDSRERQRDAATGERGPSEAERDSQARPRGARQRQRRSAREE